MATMIAIREGATLAGIGTLKAKGVCARSLWFGFQHAMARVQENGAHGPYFTWSAMVSPTAATARTRMAETASRLERSPPAGIAGLVGLATGEGAGGRATGAATGAGFFFSGGGALLGASGLWDSIFPLYARIFCVCVMYSRKSSV